MSTTPPNVEPATKDRIERARPLLVSVVQAAEILPLSRSSIYQLIWNDQLTPIRIGRSVRFSVKHLETFVADRSVGLWRSPSDADHSSLPPA